MKMEKIKISEVRGLQVVIGAFAIGWGFIIWMSVLSILGVIKLEEAQAKQKQAIVKEIPMDSHSETTLTEIQGLTDVENYKKLNKEIDAKYDELRLLKKKMGLIE